MRELGFTALQVICLFFPLILASAMSALVLRFDLFAFLRRPIDGGATVRGRRLFGENKTWRGVVVAVAGCIAGVALQKHFPVDSLREFLVVDYSRLDAVWFGLAMGGGAMLGELPNSFVKRQVGIPPGKTARGPRAALFYVWDQVDFLTACWPLLALWTRPTPALIATSVVLALAVHPTLSLIGFLVGARKTAR